MRNVLLALILLLTVTLAGCAGGPRFYGGEPEDSLAFVYLDLTEVKMKPTWLTVKQILPKTDKPYFHFSRMEDKENKYAATFVMTLSPGTYQIDNFGGEGRVLMQKVESEFNMPETGENETSFKITAPGLYYMGSYNYVPQNSNWAGFVGRGRFSLVRKNSPGKKEILTELLKHAEKTKWADRMRVELANLR